MMRERVPDERTGQGDVDAQLRHAGLDPGDVFTSLSRRKLLWRALLLLAAVMAVVLAIIEMPGLGSLRARFAHADPWWIAASAVLEAGSVACFVIALHSAFAGRVGWRSSASIGTTAQGVNAIVPAGGTAGLVVAAVILSNAGIPSAIAVSRIIALFLIASVVTNVLAIIIGGFGVASGLLPAHVTLSAALVPATLALALLVGLIYAGRRLARSQRPGHVRMSPVRRAMRWVADGVIWCGELLRAGDPLLLIGAVGDVACDLAALATAFSAVGAAGLPIGAMLLAYSLGQVGSVISLPGATEGGLVGALVLYGASLSSAVPAVLVYRAIAILVPLLLSLVGAAQLRATLGELRWGGDGRWPIQAPDTFPH
jgi:uncharacterized membrane protein YbhN (UPF0104 family)